MTLAELSREYRAQEAKLTGQIDRFLPVAKSLTGDSRREAFVMKVVPVGDDMEEFVPVEEELAEKLIDIIENSDFDEEDVDFDEE